MCVHHGVCVCSAARQGDKDVSLGLSFKDNNSYGTECLWRNKNINEPKGQNMKTTLEYGTSLMNLKLKQQSMNWAFATKVVFSYMLASRETQNLLRPKRQNKDKTVVLIPALVFFPGRKNHNVICKRFAVKSRLSFYFTLISI